ncbi:ABC transporter permease [Staphylococcus delphini]|uniref:ABC transporter permease n=1 Tax=Staphylococcus delphini TaxID=53344 RepID=UPI0021D2C02D|nr:ABC transporter permease [Staphylococcus delphini]UXS44920.1 ABC transporter permease [Staphylococcus delphini]UXV45540.1 ABC transporter permease [Staphylococcus delphini]
MKKLNYRDQRSNLIESIFKMSYIEFRALINNKHLIYTQILIPILYFLFYSTGIASTFGMIHYGSKEVSFLQFSFIGIIGLIVYSQMAQSVYRIILDRKWGLLALKYFKGVTPLAYIIGKMSFPLFNFLIQVVVLYLISLIFGDYFSVKRFILIALCSIIMMIFWFSVGTVISLKITSYKIRDLILNTLLLPVSFTAPIFFSFDKAPLLIRTISYLNPLTYQLNAMRDIGFGVSNPFNIGIVMIMAILMSTIALYSIKNAKLTTNER